MTGGPHDNRCGSFCFPGLIIMAKKQKLNSEGICEECGKPEAECQCDAKPAKKKDSVNRIDVQDFSWDYLTEKVITTDEGFLKGRAVVTNIGVFPYLMPDGSIRRELRLPEDVFDTDSLASLKMKPLTLNHPKDSVNPGNAQDLQVGSLGEQIWTDSFRVYAPLSITRQDAIDAVNGGKQALSCGYSCELEMTAGNWMGVNYDAIQRNIRYNHVALVDRGRAGDDAILRMDAADAGIYTQQNKEPAMAIKTIKLDGVSGEFQADEAVIARMNETAKRADKAESDLKLAAAAHADALAKVSADRDTNADRADKAEQALKAAQDGMPAAIQAAVANRLLLAKAATDAAVEVLPEHSDAAIMTAVVLKAFPKADAELMKNDTYLKARFDAACDVLAAGAHNDNQNRRDSGEIPAPGTNLSNQDACTAAEKKMKDNITNAWKK